MRTKIAFTRYECDRCDGKYDDLNEEYDPNDEWGRIWNNAGPIDLCPTCKKSFLEWMNILKNSPSTGASGGDV